MNVGDFYERDGFRVRVAGHRLDGLAITEDSHGFIGCIENKDNWQHLPDCDSFAWQPETFPQFYINVKAGFCDAVYVVRNSKTTYYGVQDNGERHPATLRWDAVNDRLVVLLDWKQVTQAEAEARVKKPELSMQQETPKREHVQIFASWGGCRLYATTTGSDDPKDRELKHDGTGFYLEDGK